MRVKRLCAVVVSAFAASGAHAAFTESFDNVSGLAAAGWVFSNESAPPGDDWFQGNDGVFASESGAADAYIAANFFSSSDADGAIGNWLITPVLSLPGGGTLSFSTRTADAGFLDALDVRFSSGSGSATAGFTSLLLTVGAAGSYPTDWTTYTVALPAAASGRLAFAYVVGSALDADYIGIDSLTISTPTSPPVPEPATAALLGVGLGALGLALRRRKTA